MTDKVRIQASGVELAVRVEGEGPAVLLLHGFPDSSHLWRHQISTLVDNGYRAVAPDLRGFGDSDRPPNVEDYSLMNVLSDLAMVLDALGIEKAHVVGHDWGAGTAWVFATFAPERTLSVTALSVGHPSSFGQPRIEQLQRSWYMFMFQFEGVAEEWLSRDDWAFARAWFGRNPEADKHIEDLSRPGALTAGLNWYRANIPPASWTADRGRLPPIQVPAMGVWSSEDFALTEVQMKESEKFVDGPWRYEHIDGVGHWIPVEAAEKFNALLLEFLDSVN